MCKPLVDIFASVFGRAKQKIVFLEKYDKTDICLIVLFLVISYLPLLLFSRDKVSREEKRLLSPFPSLKSFGKLNTDFPTELNDWFGDHYGLRHILINYDMLLNVKIFEISPTHKVVLGKDGWLFYSNQYDGDSVAYYQNTNLLTNNQLEMIKENMILLKHGCKKLGAGFILMIAPNKDTIYGEFYPAGIHKKSTYSQTDQITDYLNENSDIVVIDVRKSLFWAKEKEQLYYKTDTHWNNFGAFIAFQEVMKEVDRLCPKDKQDSTGDYIIKKSIRKGGDLAMMLNLKKYYDDTEFEFERKNGNLYKLISKNSQTMITEINDDKLPRAVMFGDSFSNAMIPFLSNNFGRIVYISSSFDGFDIIKKENPDIVIYEIVERHLNFLLNSGSDLTVNRITEKK